MANPTTNYSFAMPTNTDLVKDLPADFDIFGQAVDDRIKALNPETTAGDIAYRASTANAKTRLPIGTAGQILTVNSGATAPEWQTLTSGGLTLINTGGTTLTGASVTISSIPGTYTNLKVIITGGYNSTDADIQMRLNNNSTASNYDWFYVRCDNGGNLIGSATIASYGYIGAISTSSTWSDALQANVDIYRYAATENKTIFSQSKSKYSTSDFYYNSTFQFLSTAAITDITLLPSSGTFSGGTVYVYGVN